MKRTYSFFVSFAALLFFSCQQSNSLDGHYTIKGIVVDASEGDTIYLQEELEQNLIVLNQTYIKDKQFKFEGEQDSTVERIITYVKNGVKMGTVFFLESGNIEMHLAETTSITGTDTNNKYQYFLNKINGIYGQMSSVNYNLLDTMPTQHSHDDLDSKINTLDKKANELIIKTIKENINNPIGFYLFKRYNYILSPKIQLEIISKMPVSWRKNSIIEDIKTELDLLPQDSTSINIIE